MKLKNDLPLESEDRGFTLIEVTVVMLIFSVVMALVMGLLTSVQTNTNTVQSRDVAVSNASVIAEALDRQIHAAAPPSGGTNPFSTTTLPSANELVFYASLGNTYGPTLLDIKLVTPTGCSGCGYYNLVEVVTKATSTSNTPPYTGASQTVLLSTGVVMATPTTSSDCSTGSTYTTGMFEYFTAPTATPANSCLALNPGSPPALSAAQAGQVENLTVTLTTLDPTRPKSSARTTVTEVMSLPNVDYGG